MSKISCLIFLFLIYLGAQAQIQPPTFEWAKSFGGWEDDYLTDMDADDEGNVYVCGEFKDEICFDRNCLFSNISDTADIFIAKYDSLGKVAWAKTFGGRWTDEDPEIAVSPDGDIYLSGKFSDSIRIGSKVLYANDPNFYFYGAPDCFIAKLNTDGEVEWVIHPGTSHIFDLAFQNDELYVSGTLSVDSLVFGESKIWRKSNRDKAYLAKLDTNGHIIWSKTFGTVEDKYLYVSSIAVSEDERVFLCGRSIDTLFIDSLALGFNSKPLEFIIGLDKNGRALWGEYFVTDSISFYFSLNDLAVVGNNTIIGSGSLRGKIIWGDSVFRYNGSSYFNVGLDFNGNPKWLRAYRGNLSISQSTVLNKQLYVCGSLGSSISFEDTSILVRGNSFGEVVILRHDSTGALVWGKALQSPVQDAGLGIAHSAQGNIYVVGGFFDSPSLVDSFALSNTYDPKHELWVGRMKKDSFLTPVIPPKPISAIWKVFPNPFIDSVFVSGKFKSPLQLTLLDIQGRLIWESTFQTPDFPTQIPTSIPDLSPAVYVLVIQTKNKRFAFKLLKQP